jgi:hypothetical protein
VPIREYLVNKYGGINRHVLVNTVESLPCSNFIPSAKASWSPQSSFDPDDLSSDAEEYVMPNKPVETAPGWSDCSAPWLTAASLSWNLPPEAPKNCGQINPNVHDYHSDLLEISSTFWIPDITDWGHQQEEGHSKYANFSNVARDILSHIPYGV